MITPAFAQEMAAYNVWQNGNLYSAADTLDDAARTLNRGAFFGSIQGTLNHVLWADKNWLSRFAGTQKPNQSNIDLSPNETPNWDALKLARATLDQVIVDWATRLQPPDLMGDLHWLSGLSKREMQKSMSLIVVHFFNHQTHHRGQVHAMLTAAGAKLGSTDLPWRPA